MKNNNFTGDVIIAASQSKKEKAYWAGKLSGDLVKTGITYDNFKSTAGQPIMGAKEFVLPPEVSARLAWMINKSDVRLYIILLTELFILLNKYSGHDDLVVGSPIYKQEVEGDFINTVLVLRNRVEGHFTFKESLFQVKKCLDEASENQNYPLKALLHDLNLTFTDEDFPLFDTALLLENIHTKKYIQHIPLKMVFSFLRIDETIKGTIEYNRYLYKSETIERIKSHLYHLMQITLFNADIRLRDIDILSDEEKRHILYDFNATEAEYPLEKTITQLFEEKTRSIPSRAAAIYEDEHITFKELNVRANCLARVLSCKGMTTDAIACILLHRSLEMVIAITAVLKSRGAYLPLNEEAPTARNRFILEDSRAKLLLSDRNTVEKNKSILEYWPAENIVYIDDPVIYRNQEPNPQNKNKPGDLAYVIYTSGTTGNPKGVMVEHKNVVNFIYGLHDTVFQGYQKILNLGLVSSYLFDASVQLTYGALLLGHRLYIVPEYQRGDGTGLLDFYEKYEIEISDGTPLHMNMLAKSIKDYTAKLNIKHFIIGGDVILKPIAKEFLEGFAKNPPQVTNVYGPTECTVNSTSYEIRPGNIEELDYIPIGKPIPNYTIYILDKTNKPVPIGVPGEICVCGQGVVRGYLGRDELTAEKFVTDPFTPGGRMYRTGDLALWQADGNIRFIGRSDHQIKVRGYRIELGEIEKKILQHKVIKTAFVHAPENKWGDKFLCAYFTADEKLSKAELKEYLSGNLPDYMIPSYFKQLEKIPLTTSGKVDRRALPLPEYDENQEYETPRDEIEKKLVRLWAEILGLEEPKIGIRSSFFELGGHSLTANLMVLKIQKEFNLKIPLAEVFNQPSIRELAQYINNMAEPQDILIQPVEQKEFYPLSSSQKRMYIVQEMEPDSTSYNITQIAVVKGKLEKEKIKNIIDALIKRHEILRTSFEVLDGDTVQRIRHTNDIRFEIQYYESGEKQTEQIKKNFVMPFEMSKAPLLRVGLIKMSETKHLFMMDIHHILSDFVSTLIFLQDFMKLYTGEESPPLCLQYKDFSQWQNKMIDTGGLKKQEEYWLNKFKGGIPTLDMPLDYPRPQVRDTKKGETLNFELDKELSGKIHEVMDKTGKTLFMVLSAAYYVLLSKYTGKFDIVVCTPVTARSNADLQNIMGVFLNMVAIRNKPEGSKTFKEFLEEMKENALEAYKNQDYPFDQLILKLGLHGNTAQNPLFDTEFTVNVMDIETVELPGLKLEVCDSEAVFAKFDLHFLAVDRKDMMIHMVLRYSTELFSLATIEKMKNHYIEILSQVVENLDIKLDDISLSHDYSATRPDLTAADDKDFDL
jgi:amino acid adenylation domain-containing protein